MEGMPSGMVIFDCPREQAQDGMLKRIILTETENAIWLNRFQWRRYWKKIKGWVPPVVPVEKEVDVLRMWDDEEPDWEAQYYQDTHQAPAGHEEAYTSWRNQWYGFVKSPEIQVRQGVKSSHDPFYATGPGRYYGARGRKTKMQWYSRDITGNTMMIQDALALPDAQKGDCFDLLGFVAKKFGIEFPEVIERYQLLDEEQPMGMPDYWEKKKFLADTIFLKAYPAMRRPVEEGRTNKLPYGFKAPFKKDSVADVTEELFGTRGSATVKAVGIALAKQRDGGLLYSWLLKKQLPLESVRELLLRGPWLERGMSRKEKKSFKDLFSNYPHQRIVKLFTEDNTHQYPTMYHLTDTLRMWDNEALREIVQLPEKPASMREIHDHLAREENRLRYENKEIKYSDEWQEIQGTKLGLKRKQLTKADTQGITTPTKHLEAWQKQPMVHELSIRLPEWTHEIVGWGSEMNNCIAGYADLAWAKDIILGALLDPQGKVKYNFMVERNRIVQLYGPHNMLPSTEDAALFNTFMIKRGLVSIGFSTMGLFRGEAPQPF